MCSILPYGYPTFVRRLIDTKQHLKKKRFKIGLCLDEAPKLTQMFEKIVPNNRNISRGSNEHMSFLDSSTHVVVITNNAVKGIRGRSASRIGRIFPVLFL